MNDMCQPYLYYISGEQVPIYKKYIDNKKKYCQLETTPQSKIYTRTFSARGCLLGNHQIAHEHGTGLSEKAKYCYGPSLTKVADVTAAEFAPSIIGNSYDGMFIGLTQLLCMGKQ